ncbi:MAG: lysine biosynthesis protein LysW [Planctomycetes bacterium]|nr:lysine biosynthesis protein LysW [Planctomycetota bacterium]
MSKTSECPECGEALTLEEGTIQGEIMQCPSCGVELEVTSVDPFEVEPAPEEEEDWGE